MHKINPTLFTLFLLITAFSLVGSALAELSAGQVRQIGQLVDPQNEADDQFGYSVAINGDLAAVGAPQFLGGQSLAYLYAKEGNNWIQVAKLEDGVGSDQFGWSVAVSDNVVAVGTPHAGIGGAVFVFVKPQGGWTDMFPTAELSTSINGQGIGVSVSISSDGKTVIVGGPGQGGSSGAFVFEEPDSGWADMMQATAILSSSSGYEVGGSVAINENGDTVAAGSAGHGGNAAAYVFVKPSTGWTTTFQPNAALTASDESRLDDFSASVAISGTTIVVGAPLHRMGNGPGAAYVYVEPKTGWQSMTQTAELSVPASFNLELGYAVAASGNLVLGGAPRNTIDHNVEQGSVFGYLKPAGSWKNTTQPSGAGSASGGQAKEEFGYSIAISGSNIIVGAPYYGGSLQGAAYIFSLQ